MHSWTLIERAQKNDVRIHEFKETLYVTGDINNINIRRFSLINHRMLRGCFSANAESTVHHFPYQKEMTAQYTPNAIRQSKIESKNQWSSMQMPRIQSRTDMACHTHQDHQQWQTYSDCDIVQHIRKILQYIPPVQFPIMQCWN